MPLASHTKDDIASNYYKTVEKSNNSIKSIRGKVFTRFMT